MEITTAMNSDYSKAQIDSLIAGMSGSGVAALEKWALDLDYLAYRDGQNFQDSPELQESVAHVLKNRRDRSL